MSDDAFCERCGERILMGETVWATSSGTIREDGFEPDEDAWFGVAHEKCLID